MIHKIINNTFCTFSVLSFVFGILCKAGILEDLPYTQVVFTLICMSLATTGFVVVRERLLREITRIAPFLDIIGCSVIILIIGNYAGWLEYSISYLGLILLMVVMVYLFVWLLTWLRSKHDEEELNRILGQQNSDKNS